MIIYYVDEGLFIPSKETLCEAVKIYNEIITTQPSQSTRSYGLIALIAVVLLVWDSIEIGISSYQSGWRAVTLAELLPNNMTEQILRLIASQNTIY